MCQLSYSEALSETNSTLENQEALATSMANDIKLHGTKHVWLQSFDRPGRYLFLFCS